MAEAEWRVGDLVTLQRGTTYEGAAVGQDGPALLGLGSIEPGGGFRATHFKTFGGACPTKLMVAPGEMYVALKGATKDGSMVGSVARVPSWLQGGGRLTQDTARLDFTAAGQGHKDFLYWMLRTPQYRAYCGGRITGSASASFSRDDFLKYQFPVPTPRRLRVVETLGALDDKIELNLRLSETLESATRTVFARMFLSGPDALQWPVESLGDHVEAVRGLSYKGDGLATTGTPLHNLHSIRAGGGYNADGIKWYTGGHRERHLVAPGDIIVANTDLSRERLLIGFAAMVPVGFGSVSLYSHHLYRVRVKPESPLTADYVYHLLNAASMRGIVSGYSNGTTVQMLPVEALRQPRVAIPPAWLVREFDHVSRLARDRQENSARQIAALASMRDTLLPGLISGDRPASTSERWGSGDLE